MSDYVDEARRVAEGIRAVTRFDEALAVLLVYEERVRAEERDLAAMIAQGVTHDPQCGEAFEGYRCCRCRAEAAEAELASIKARVEKLDSLGYKLAREVYLAYERDDPAAMRLFWSNGPQRFAHDLLRITSRPQEPKA